MKLRIPRWRRTPSIGKCSLLVVTGLISVILLVIQWHYHLSVTAVIRGTLNKELGLSGSEQLDREARNEESTGKKIIEGLTQQIEELKSQLNKKIDQLARFKTMGKNEKISVLNSVEYPDSEGIKQYIKTQIDKAYILHPHQYRNEYGIPPFSSFTRKSIFRLELGLMKQPEVVMPFYVDLQEDLLEVIDKGMNVINDSDMDFIEGFYRIQYRVGTQYELAFRSTVNSSAPMLLVTLFRPFGPLRMTSINTRETVETIYVIVPLKGRGDSLRRFMENFESAAIAEDGHIHLTVVCYGDEAVTDAKEILNEIERKTNFKSYQIISGESGEFSRGRALHVGASKLPVDNPLMFFCDVDMFFNSQFLLQCRTETKPGSKVFYPIVFSLYNPEIVYKEKTIPSLKEQQVIRRDNGFWRDFGFGMTCQYRNDFNDIGGFDLTIKGWGSEDVLLYRKYTRSPKYQVIRTPVNSLFHHWHPKHCDKSLSLEQYNACLRTRSLTEGSQIQLGMLYLGEKKEES